MSEVRLGSEIRFWAFLLSLAVKWFCGQSVVP